MKLKIFPLFLNIRKRIDDRIHSVRRNLFFPKNVYSIIRETLLYDMRDI